MNIKRIATLSAGAAVLAAMIAGATTSGVRRRAPLPPPPNTSAIDLQGAELAAEVARLRARLRPADQPQEPARNLFRFGGRARQAETAEVPDVIATAASPAPLPPPPPPMTLVGVAADTVDGMLVRTAIISASADVLLVKEGETLAADYKVGRIAADGVEIVPVSGGPSFILKLPQ